MGWLNRFAGRNAANVLAEFSRLAPGDEVRAGDETWTVSAVLVYRSGEDEWPAVKLAHGATSAWAVLEGDHVARYDPVQAQVDPEGRARLDGHTYTRDEMGAAVIARAEGDVDARPGDTLGYQVLRSPDDPARWISVESWAGGFVEISAGRLWSVDAIVARGGARR